MTTPSVDSAGTQGTRIVGVERRGVDYIPEAGRHSNLFRFGIVWVGAQLSFNLLVLGWLPISFGLGWWGAFTSITVGLAVGTAIYSPFALLGLRTGTNSAVSSGAHFGVVGRLVGTFLAMFVALGFFGLAIWTGGDSLAFGLGKLVGLDGSSTIRAIGYAAMGVVALALAVYGHDKVVSAQKWVSLTIGAMFILGIIALGGQFDPNYAGGDYVLGGYWPTWMLGFVTAFAAPISYAPFVNDYARYLSPRRFTPKQVVGANAIGMFVGCWFVMAFGAFVGTLAPIKFGPVGSFVEASPIWYIVPIMLIGTVGTLAQAAVCLYGTGLDTSSLIPRLRRPIATILLGTIGLLLVYLGAFVWDAITLINAFVILLTIVTAPWVVINLIGYVSRRGWYNPADIQVFNRGLRGGSYWFVGGWNLRAVGAWIPAVIFGVLAAQTSAFTGPMATVAGGVDISIVSSMVIAAVIYLVLLKLFPEDPAVRGYSELAPGSPLNAPADKPPQPPVPEKQEG